MQSHRLFVSVLVMALIMGATPAAAAGTPGTEKWAFSTIDEVPIEQVRSSPAVGADGTVYFGVNNNLYAFNPGGGEPKWVFINGGLLHSSPAIGADGTVYVGGEDGNLYAVNPEDGSPKWASPFATGGYVGSSPAIGVDGTIYFGSADGKLYAVTDNVTNASKQWDFFTGGFINHSSPAIGADGTIYIGTRIGGGAIPENGNLLALTDNGASANPTLKWAAFVTGGYVDSSPAIGADGTVYVGSKKIIGVGVPEITGVFYAVYSESLGLAKSAWPMFHQNLRHTSLGKLGTDIAPINFLLLGD